MKSDSDNSQIASVVKLVQAGNVEARGQLIDLTQAAVYKFCLLLCHNREVAEDICQEALIKALQNIEKLKNPITFLAWTYQISKNLFLDQKRSAASKNEVHTPVETERASVHDMDEILTVQKVLSQFEGEDRFLLLLIELEGCSYKEAGEFTGLSEDAVRSKLHRLRQQFVDKFQKLKA